MTQGHLRSVSSPLEAGGSLWDTHNKPSVSLRWKTLWSHPLFCFTLTVSLCYGAMKQSHKVNMALGCRELSVKTIQVAVAFMP